MAAKKRNYGLIVLEPKKKPRLYKLTDKHLSLEQMYSYCECEVITFANAYDYNSVFQTDYTLVCDDNGLIVENPIINHLATVMYNFPNVLAGTCLVVREARQNEEPDVYAIDIDECTVLFNTLCSTYEFLKLEGVIR